MAVWREAVHVEPVTAPQQLFRVGQIANQIGDAAAVVAPRLPVLDACSPVLSRLLLLLQQPQMLLPALTSLRGPPTSLMMGVLRLQQLGGWV